MSFPRPSFLARLGVAGGAGRLAPADAQGTSGFSYVLGAAEPGTIGDRVTFEIILGNAGAP